MKIELSPEQEQWIKAQIAHGEFVSVDDAVRSMIADRMTFGSDDLGWAKTYVDEARAAVARGEVVSLEAATADIDKHLASLQA